MNKTYKFQVMLIAIVVLLIATTGYLTYTRTSMYLLKEEVESNKEQLDHIESYTDQYFSIYEKILHQASANIIQPSNNADILLLQSYLDTYTSTYDSIKFMYVVFEDKNLYSQPTIDLPPDYDPTTSKWYKQIKEEDSFTWSEVFMDDTTGELFISAGLPIHDISGSFIGHLSLDLNLDAYHSYVSSIVLGDLSYAFITTKDGRYLIHPNPDLFGAKLPVIELSQAIERFDSGILEYEWDTVPRIGIYNSIPSMDWAVVTTTNADNTVLPISFVISFVPQISMILLVLISHIVIILVSTRRNSAQIEI